MSTVRLLFGSRYDISSRPCAASLLHVIPGELQNSPCSCAVPTQFPKLRNFLEEHSSIALGLSIGISLLSSSFGSQFYPQLRCLRDLLTTSSPHYSHQLPRCWVLSLVGRTPSILHSMLIHPILDREEVLDCLTWCGLFSCPRISTITLRNLSIQPTQY